MGKSFTIFQNWLTLGGVILPGSTKPQMSKHQNKIPGEYKLAQNCVGTWSFICLFAFPVKKDYILFEKRRVGMSV